MKASPQLQKKEKGKINHWGVKNVINTKQAQSKRTTPCEPHKPWNEKNNGIMTRITIITVKGIITTITIPQRQYGRSDSTSYGMNSNRQRTKGWSVKQTRTTQVKLQCKTNAKTRTTGSTKRKQRSSEAAEVPRSGKAALLLLGQGPGQWKQQLQ